MLLRLRCFNLTWNLLCWATSLPSGGEILFRLCYHLICFVFVHIVPQIRLDQTIDTRHNFFFYIRGSDSFTTDHGPQTQLSNTQVMPVCHLLYWHRNKRRQLLLNKTMSWYNLTQTPNVQGLCVLDTRLLRICTSNSGVLYKLDQASVSSHQVCMHPHISIWCAWLWTSPWLSRGMYWAMMARISESMYLRILYLYTAYPAIPAATRPKTTTHRKPQPASDAPFLLMHVSCSFM